MESEEITLSDKKGQLRLVLGSHPEYSAPHHVSWVPWKTRSRVAESLDLLICRFDSGAIQSFCKGFRIAALDTCFTFTRKWITSIPDSYSELSGSSETESIQRTSFRAVQMLWCILVEFGLVNSTPLHRPDCRRWLRMACKNRCRAA
jgi:hypothetical protein